MKIVNNFGGIDKEIYNIGDILHKVGKNYLRALPIVCNEDGEDFEDYRIYGAAGGMGDEVPNLWNEDYTGITTSITYVPISVSDGAYTMSTNTPLGTGGCSLFLLPGNVSSGASTAIYGVYSGRDRTVTAIDGYITVAYRIYDNIDPQNYQTMLNAGNAALPYGCYKVDMSVRSANLCFKTITSTNIDTSGNITNNQSYAVEVFEIVQGKTYTIKCSARAVVYAMYAQEPMGAGSLSYDGNRIVVTEYTETFVAPINGYCAVRRGIDANKTIAVDGSVAPNNYQPYSNTTVPIYIGSSPLEADEYIDYDSGKIYRMNGGVLTPTDPPVPLPSIPTVNGKTTVNYAGTGTVPEKVWFSGMEFEIEDVYFGDKHIFSVWGEYDGTLPAQFNANGENLVQYQVYGNTGGAGDKTVNLFDKTLWNDVKVTRGTVNILSNGVELTATENDAYTQTYSPYNSDKYTYPVTEGSTYTLSWNIDNPQIYGAVYIFTGSTAGNTVLTYCYASVKSVTFTIPNGHKYLCFRLGVMNSGDTLAYTNIMLTPGSTAPTSYIPYGYEVDMGVQSANEFDIEKISAGDAGTGKIEISGKELIVTCYSGSSAIRDANSNTLIDLAPNLEVGETYYLSATSTGTDKSIYLTEADINWNFGSSKTLTQQMLNSVVRWRASGTNTTATISDIQISAGSTPLPYQPYSKTVTPIYIGSDPLGEDEYVDYGEGKIYRKNQANYFDGYFELGAIDYNTGAETPSNTSIRTDFIELEPSNRYYIKWETENLYILPVSYDENKNYVKYLGAKTLNPSYFNLGANEKYIRFYLYNRTTPPKEMMVCKNADAPYYDPQDPPVPLPQLPTCNGVTITDYAGQSAPPSEFYAKYRKQNF